MSELIGAEAGKTLIKLDEARRRISLAREMAAAEELHEWRDRAAAMLHYSKMRGDSQEAANQAAEIKVRAEAALGALDKEAKPAHRRNKSSLSEDLPPDLGVAAATRANWRKLGELDEEKLDEVIQQVKESDDNISTAAVVSVVKKQENSRARNRDQEAREIALADVEVDAQGENWRVLGGDFRERLSELPDGSVDLILTDPPYPAEFMSLWSDLSKHASRVLAPQGILCALTGTIYLPEVMQRLGEHLQFGWVYMQPMAGGQNSRIMGRHILQDYKPWLAYSNGAWPSGRIDWHADVLDPARTSKGSYRWEQDAGPTRLLLDCLCPENGTVLDPYLGTGAFGVAALESGRKFIGVEADSNRIDTATNRLTGWSGSN